jgi:DNA polymerase-3 subunit alpha
MNHREVGVEHIHTHSHYSLLDGIGTIEEHAERRKEINQRFLCITDHGVMGAIPDQIKEGEAKGLHPLFGCELYTNRLQPEVEYRAQSAEFRKDLSEADQKKFDRSPHLVAVAETDEGYSNLVRMSSWAWMHGFYRKPRINYDILRKYHEGIVFTTACAASQTAVAFFDHGEEAAYAELEELISIIGKNHLYLEINMLDFEPQKPYNQFMIKCHYKYGLPLYLAQDAHYAKKEHALLQQLALLGQTKRTLADINAMIASGEAGDIFELQDKNLYIKSEHELDEMYDLKYKDIIPYDLYVMAKENSVRIAERCKGVQIDREVKLPQFPEAEAKLWEETERGFKLRGCPDNSLYHERIKEEYDLICEKGFASYFLIEKEMLDVARVEGAKILGFGSPADIVGPGRGSVCGSLLAYCLRIHDVEPIIHDLRFSRFLSPARGGKQQRIRHTQKPVPRDQVVKAA